MPDLLIELFSEKIPARMQKRALDAENRAKEAEKKLEELEEQERALALAEQVANAEPQFTVPTKPIPNDVVDPWSTSPPPTSSKNKFVLPKTLPKMPPPKLTKISRLISPTRKHNLN